MRVIAGEMKGRQLKAVPGKSTRPTTDKVKEAIFQIIGPFFLGGKCLDLFAGSGSLGIEAISRGMERCVFVDNNSKAIHTVYQNLNALNITQKAEVYRTDAFRALHAAAKRGLKFDLVLFDPPYGKVNYGKILQTIEGLQLLTNNATIYCEHDIVEKMPVNIGQFTVIKQESYSGTTGITIYKKN